MQVDNGGDERSNVGEKKTKRNKKHYDDEVTSNHRVATKPSPDIPPPSHYPLEWLLVLVANGGWSQAKGGVTLLRGTS